MACARAIAVNISVMKLGYVGLLCVACAIGCAHAPLARGTHQSAHVHCVAATEGAWAEAISVGRQSSSDDVDHMETRLDADPSQWMLRLSILAYYSRPEQQQWIDDRESNAAIVHLEWLVKHCPGSPALREAHLVSAMQSASQTIYRLSHERIRPLWLEAVKRRPGDSDVLLNAARYFSLRPDNGPHARRILIKLISLEPKKTGHKLELARLEASDTRIRDLRPEQTARHAEEAMRWFAEAAIARDDRYIEDWLLYSAAKAAKDAGTAVPQHAAALTYYGETLLGLLALRRQDLELARAHLVAAKEALVSAPTASVRVYLALAIGLFDTGESTLVVEYLEACRGFLPEKDWNEWMRIASDREARPE